MGVLFVALFELKGYLGLRALDWGELIYAGLAGALIFGMFLIFCIKGSKQYNDTTKDIVLLFGLFLFFGIAIDMVHSFFTETYMVGAILSLVEDGGEMLVLSFLVWYFSFLVFHVDGKRAYLYGILFGHSKNPHSPIP